MYVCIYVCIFDVIYAKFDFVHFPIIKNKNA